MYAAFLRASPLRAYLPAYPTIASFLDQIDPAIGALDRLQGYEIHLPMGWSQGVNLYSNMQERYLIHPQGSSSSCRH
jgi:hypothetical protein